MNVPRILPPKGSYLWTFDGIVVLLGMIASIAGIVVIGWALVDIPESGNLWIAMFISFTILISAFLHLRTAIMDKL